MSEMPEKRFPFELWHILAFGLGFFYIPLIFISLIPASQFLSYFLMSNNGEAFISMSAVYAAIFWSLPAIVYLGFYLFSSIRWRQSDQSGLHALKITLLLSALLSQAALIILGAAIFIIAVVAFGFSSWLNWGAAIA